MVVTEPLTRILADAPTTDTVTGAIVAVAPGSVDNSLLSFRELRLLSYQ